jgi:hypothetical protein
VTVSVDNSAPRASVSRIIYGVFDSVHIGNSLTLVPSGTGFILAVLNVDQSLVHGLSDSVSSETSKNALLIEPDWLGLVELLLLAHFFHFSHSSLF